MYDIKIVLYVFNTINDRVQLRDSEFKYLALSAKRKYHTSPDLLSVTRIGSVLKMADGTSGKLELLLAHLSINNVHHVKPLLFDAIDEYQHIRSQLTYDEKKNVNFIKTLLWHVEREEWPEARDNLQGAQRAYQEYLDRQATSSKRKVSQLH